MSGFIIIIVLGVGIGKYKGPRRQAREAFKDIQLSIDHILFKVGDLGFASELGNYAEYSGAPNEEEVLQYARVVIDCATADPDGRKRALVIGGGIANFTDVAATFSGIIRALKEKLSKVPEDMFPETEGTTDDDNVQINQLPEALRDVVTVLGFTESATIRTEVMTDFVLTSGAALLPHPSKVLTGGEDAYFIAGQTWLGVADGVVQWSLEGTEPGVYAQDLIRNCENLASDYTGNTISYPIDLLKSSSAEMPSSGYSTVLIAQFDGQVLHVANVGDSGFIILRHGTVYKRSSPMLHAFHFPMLFAKDNDPSHISELYEVELEEDDVIITATDGLFDNLYDQEISSIVMKSLAAELELEESKLKAAQMHLYVRRGGPNYQKGLARMRTLAEEIGLPIEVYGPEATMTGICKQAIECISAAA